MHNLAYYFERPNTIRKGRNQLFISYNKPHKPVFKDTISRWLKLILKSSGIDITIFKPHSIQSATTLVAKLKGVQLTTIMMMEDGVMSVFLKNFMISL